METFLLNLLKTSLLGSLAILAMLVLKPLWRERYRAKTRCWLWLALAAFLLQNQSGKLFVEVFAIGMAITESDNS